MRALDHIAVSASTLEDGIRAVQAALGVSLQPGGKHSYMGTHNALLGLGPDLYLEVIAVDPAAPRPAYPRWFDLDHFSGPPRLTNWILRVPDLDAALAQSPEGTGRPVSLARGDFRWRMGVPADGRLPFDNLYPALIQWQEVLHPSDRLPDSGCRLVGLELFHPQAVALRRAVDLDDPRITISEGPAPRLRALFETPDGQKILE